MLNKFGWLTHELCYVCAYFQLDWPKIRVTFGQRQSIHSNYDWYIKFFGPQGKEHPLVSSINNKSGFWLQWATTNEHIRWIQFISTISFVSQSASASIPTCICIRIRAGAHIGGMTNGFNFVFPYIVTACNTSGHFIRALFFDKQSIRWYVWCS